jgi:hypothetical protein
VSGPPHELRRRSLGGERTLALGEADEGEGEQQLHRSWSTDQKGWGRGAGETLVKNVGGMATPAAGRQTLEPYRLPAVYHDRLPCGPDRGRRQGSSIARSDPCEASIQNPVLYC